MFTRFTLSIVTLILLFSLAGCGNTTPTTPVSNDSSADTKSETSETYTETNAANNYQMLPVISGKAASINLDADADGTTQNLKLGEVMEITLESNPSTGYSWFASISNPDVLAQIGEPEYTAPSDEGSTMVLGAAGTETFMFQGTSTGSVTLTLEYKRGWEQDVPAEKTITITVEVNGKASNLQLDASADGTTQKVNQGDIIAVILESNITTGYSWFATISDPKILVQMGEPEYLEPVSNSGTPLLGAAGKQTFLLQAAETGTATVTFEYMRSFEENVAPEKTITITIEVK
jgi:inhibitor of cysteine peptidase